MSQNTAKKIIIVRVISRLNIGGPSIHTILLTEGLDKKLFKTYLLSGKPDVSEGDMSYLAEAKDISIEYIPEMGREIGFNDFVAFFKIFKFLRRIKPDIIHTHAAKAGTLGRLAAIFSGVPTRIHTFHGHIFDGYFNPLKTRFFMTIEKCLSLFTDKIIVVSESVKDEVTNKFRIVPRNKCAVIKLGLDLSEFLDNDGLKGRFRSRLKVDEKTFLVGIIGRLVPIKNHKMFLAAAKRLKELEPSLKIKFVIVGDGELNGAITKSVHELGLDDDIVFTGWLKDLSEVYADLDVVALTSLNEGTPVALIEAMASGKPVIATNVGGVKDIVLNGNNGFLIRSDDAGEFADKLALLLKDEGMRLKMGAFGRNFVKTDYSKERLMDDMEKLYKELILTKRSINEK